MTKHERLTILVDRKVQFALTRRIVTHWCLFMLCSGTLNLIIHRLRSPELTWMENLQGLWSEQLPFFGVSLMLLPLFLLDTLQLSHRFVGPMVRFRQTMRSINSGKQPNELFFRPGDFWHEIANDMNGLIMRLSLAGFGNSPEDCPPTTPAINSEAQYEKKQFITN